MADKDIPAPPTRADVLALSKATSLAALRTIWKGIYDRTAPPVVVPPKQPTFTVSGRQILDQNNKPVFLVGANVAPQIIAGPYGFTQPDGRSAQGHVADAKAWGWNAIRVTVPSNGIGVSMTQTVAGVKALIDEYTAAGIVCIVEWHGATGVNQPFNHFSHDPARQFWSALLPQVKTNPHVWVNFENEPITSLRKDGSSLWIDYNKAVVDWVRPYAPTNIIVADLPDSGQGDSDPAAIIDYKALCAMPNVVLSWHNYGAVIQRPEIGGDAAYYNVPNVGWYLRPDPALPVTQEAQVKTWLSTFAALLFNANLPVIIGECGFDWDNARQATGTVPRGYPLERVAAQWSLDKATVQPLGISGVLAWHGNTESGIGAHSLRKAALPWYDTVRPVSELGTLLRSAAGV